MFIQVVHAVIKFVDLQYEERNMTIQDIKDMNKEVLTPGDVAPVLGCDPNLIRHQVTKDAKQLGFPVCKIGTRIKIPRQAFINWFEGN